MRLELRDGFIREQTRGITAPPCFDARMDWVEFLVAAALAQKFGETSGPLVMVAGEPVRFNYAYDFCGDCTDDYRRKMAACSRCRPTHLKQQRPSEVAA